MLLIFKLYILYYITLLYNIDQEYNGYVIYINNIYMMGDIIYYALS